jgi:coenzyme PQQ biosynthesis protein PqqD
VIRFDGESRPKLAKKARLRWDARDNAHLLLYPERGLRLNETASVIVKLCDGEHTVAMIARELEAQLVGERPASVEREVIAFLERLAERGLVELVSS